MAQNKTTNTQEIKHTYSTEAGVVIGKMYGGGIGFAEARNFQADSVKELKEKVQKAFELGSLDKGFDFEKLLAAGVVIVDEANTIIEDQVFTATKKENFKVGDTDLFDEQVEAGNIYDENAEDNED